MIIGKGKVTVKSSGNGGYKSVWIYIPTKIAKDSSFPFKEKEEVLIEINDDGTLLITKSDEISEFQTNSKLHQSPSETLIKEGI